MENPHHLLDERSLAAQVRVVSTVYSEFYDSSRVWLRSGLFSRIRAFMNTKAAHGGMSKNLCASGSQIWSAQVGPKMGKECL